MTWGQYVGVIRILTVLGIGLTSVFGAIPLHLAAHLPGPSGQINRVSAHAASAEAQVQETRALVGPVYDRLEIQDRYALEQGRTDVPAPRTLPTSLNLDDRTCRDVFIVGVRGSGETSEDFHGLGGTVATAVTTMSEGLDDALVGVSALEYPAAPVTQVLRDPRGYAASIDAGVVELSTTLQRRAQWCPAETQVVVGYSQGAMVVHKTLNHLSDSAPAVLSSIGAVLMISNGFRDPATPTIDYGSAQLTGNHRGIGYLLDPSVQKLPEGIARRVVEVCDDGDPVCTNISGLGGSGLQIHNNYKLGNGSAREAALAAARLMTYA